MPPKDKLLARLSDGTTLAVLAGIVVMVLLLPGHESGQKKIGRKTSHAVAVTPPHVEVQHAKPAPTAPVLGAEQSKPSTAGAATAPAEQPAEQVVDKWSEAEQAAGLRECVRLMAPVAAEVTLEEPMRKGACGMAAPVLLHSVGGAAKVSFDPAPRMNCRLAAQLTRWVETVLQPAAREVLGARITRIVGASSYSCRNMYNKPNLPLSQHATGSAVDIAGFITADGRRISVVKGWGPTERDIVAAKQKIEDAAKAQAGRAKNKSENSETAEASAEKASKKKNDEGKVHKAGFKTDERARPTLVATALTAANTNEALFLKRLHRGACTVFGTVLGPEANEAHRNHFHFDVKERKHRGVCH
jgi:hypothetical protein